MPCSKHPQPGGEVWWVEEGFDLAEAAHVWKEKVDKKSGKTFFVNLGTQEKKWKLPGGAEKKHEKKKDKKEKKEKKEKHGADDSVAVAASADGGSAEKDKSNAKEKKSKKEKKEKKVDAHGGAGVAEEAASPGSEGRAARASPRDEGEKKSKKDRKKGEKQLLSAGSSPSPGSPEAVVGDEEKKTSTRKKKKKLEEEERQSGEEEILARAFAVPPAWGSATEPDSSGALPPALFGGDAPWASPSQHASSATATTAAAELLGGLGIAASPYGAASGFSGDASWHHGSAAAEISPLTSFTSGSGSPGGELDASPLMSTPPPPSLPRSTAERAEVDCHHVDTHGVEDEDEDEEEEDDSDGNGGRGKGGRGRRPPVPPSPFQTLPKTPRSARKVSFVDDAPSDPANAQAATDSAARDTMPNEGGREREGTTTLGSDGLPPQPPPPSRPLPLPPHFRQPPSPPSAAAAGVGAEEVHQPPPVVEVEAPHLFSSAPGCGLDLDDPAFSDFLPTEPLVSSSPCVAVPSAAPGPHVAPALASPLEPLEHPPLASGSNPADGDPSEWPLGASPRARDAAAFSLPKEPSATCYGGTSPAAAELGQDEEEICVLAATRVVSETEKSALEPRLSVEPDGSNAETGAGGSTRAAPLQDPPGVPLFVGRGADEAARAPSPELGIADSSAAPATHAAVRSSNINTPMHAANPPISSISSTSGGSGQQQRLPREDIPTPRWPDEPQSPPPVRSVAELLTPPRMSLAGPSGEAATTTAAAADLEAEFDDFVRAERAASEQAAQAPAAAAARESASPSAELPLVAAATLHPALQEKLRAVAGAYEGPAPLDGEAAATRACGRLQRRRRPGVLSKVVDLLGDRFMPGASPAHLEAVRRRELVPTMTEAELRYFRRLQRLEEEANARIARLRKDAAEWDAASSLTIPQDEEDTGDPAAATRGGSDLASRLVSTRRSIAAGAAAHNKTLHIAWEFFLAQLDRDEASLALIETILDP